MSWDGVERRQLPTSCQQGILDRLTTVEHQLDALMKLKQTSDALIETRYQENQGFLRRIGQSLWGNGNPSEGFVVRVDRLEQTLKVVIWGLAITSVSITGLVVSKLGHLLAHG